MARASTLGCVVSLVIVAGLALGVAESSVVREIGKQVDSPGGAIPGLAHITVAGAVRHGMKEVEVWVETVAPGRGTPIHRHVSEEIFIVVSGGGTVYIAPESENSFPGEPVATRFSANSTFSIPANFVHQVTNTNGEDLHFYVAISKPPMQSYVYKDWNTHHRDAVLISLPWDQPEAEATSPEDEL